MLVAVPLPVLAQYTPAGHEKSLLNSFSLGEIIVTGTRGADQPTVTGSIVSAEAIERFNRVSVDEAVNLMPGVSSSNSGGSRNERLIFVRGFDRFQVPLSIDGIRVYLPADNRLDFGRFLTPDVAQVQVAKGYASVMDGPGAMGGAINLVTRTPTKPLEIEVRSTLSLDRDGEYAGYNVFGLIGTKQESWYAQASYTRNRQDHWDLARGFTPTANQAAGKRGLTDTTDWRVNAKVGITPNDTDEYALSYTRQEGSKNAPIETTAPLPAQRYWQWPYWNIESIYFLSTTALGEDATLKTRVYRNTFDNLLRSFDQRAQTSQTFSRAFNSYYADDAFGGSTQFDLRLPANNRLSITFFYRRDRHDEWQQVFPSGLTEPRQRSVEDTYSAAIEDEIAFSPVVSLTLGASYDWRDLGQAQDYSGVPGAAGSGYVNYLLRNAQAVNGQGRLSWHPDETRELYVSLSSRTRFPTLFERFSSRFGGATSNADLQSERATQAEVGGRWQFGPLKLESAAYHAWLNDVVFAFPLIFNGQPVTQSRNIGSGHYYGAEISLEARIGDTLTLGGNYSRQIRDISDPTNAAFRPTGVPRDKAFLYALWRLLPELTITPSLDLASSRWTANTAGTRWTRTGSYALAGLRADLALTEGFSIGAGAMNAFDDNYTLVDGFPEPGRRLFASMSAKF